LVGEEGNGEPRRKGKKKTKMSTRVERQISIVKKTDLMVITEEVNESEEQFSPGVSENIDTKTEGAI
jgi:hypothetical protein